MLRRSTELKQFGDGDGLRATCDAMFIANVIGILCHELLGPDSSLKDALNEIYVVRSNLRDKISRLLRATQTEHYVFSSTYRSERDK